MLNNEWRAVEGFSNMGEDDETIVARMTDEGTITAGYLAYGGLKIVDISGVNNDCKIANKDNVYAGIKNLCGDDWEIAVATKVNDMDAVVIIDSNSEVVILNSESGEEIENQGVNVSYSEEYDAEDLEELAEEEYDLLNEFGLV